MDSREKNTLRFYGTGLSPLPEELFCLPHRLLDSPRNRLGKGFPFRFGRLRGEPYYAPMESGRDILPRRCCLLLSLYEENGMGLLAFQMSAGEPLDWDTPSRGEIFPLDQDLQKRFATWQTWREEHPEECTLPWRPPVEDDGTLPHYTFRLALTEKGTPLPARVWTHMAETCLATVPVSRFILCGEDPLLHPQLSLLLDSLQDLEGCPVELETEGSRLTDLWIQNNIRSLAGIRLRLDSPDVLSPRDLGRICQRILLRCSPSFITLVTTVSHGNRDVLLTPQLGMLQERSFIWQVTGLPDGDPHQVSRQELDDFVSRHAASLYPLQTRLRFRFRPVPPPALEIRPDGWLTAPLRGEQRPLVNVLDGDVAAALEKLSWEADLADRRPWVPEPDPWTQVAWTGLEWYAPPVSGKQAPEPQPPRATETRPAEAAPQPAKPKWQPATPPRVPAAKEEPDSIPAREPETAVPQEQLPQPPEPKVQPAQEAAPRKAVPQIVPDSGTAPVLPEESLPVNPEEVSAAPSEEAEAESAQLPEEDLTPTAALQDQDTGSLPEAGAGGQAPEEESPAPAPEPEPEPPAPRKRAGAKRKKKSPPKPAPVEEFADLFAEPESDPEEEKTAADEGNFSLFQEEPEELPKQRKLSPEEEADLFFLDVP